MKTILILTLILAATLAVAAVPPYGAWEWFETEESYGVFIRPADVGYTVQYDFRADMTCTEYRNQIVFQEGTYWVDEVVVHGQTITVLSMDFGGMSPEYCAYRIHDNGQLVMHWGMSEEGMPSYPIERYAPRGPVDTADRSWGGIKSLFR